MFFENFVLWILWRLWIWGMAFHAVVVFAVFSNTFIYFSLTVQWIVLIGKPNMKMTIIGIQKIWKPLMIIIQMLTILKEPLLKSVPFQIWIFFWIRKSIAMTQRCDLHSFPNPISVNEAKYFFSRHYLKFKTLFFVLL